MKQQPNQVTASVDAMPANAEALAGLPPEERAAIYLNSIRKMMIFFTVLAVLALIAGVIFGVIGIQDMTRN